ncbi:DUF4214 domain-containing protein [Ramlibacter sp. WS9]|uniref:DUF4214 domain-containing protein n=1 Tax=Ramlibacter sp. WS9 TaxID=1882741 RepID=UPI0011421DFB|nr:DUF4214 domain-containing protein [Ramlibacter sp. WS9]ROZ63411.1 DUF4214 domain-containing protein [Ramlibacter sp. WS9]
MDSTNTKISQLYAALFGRAPDWEGLQYWKYLMDLGQMAVVADQMFATAPARAYFPNEATNEQVIASFYVNVLGRIADAEGLAFWTAQLNKPGATPGSVISAMIDVIAHYTGTDPAGLVSAALFNNRTAAAQFYAEGGGSVANATQVLAGVTAQAQSVLDARVIEMQNVGGQVNVGGYTDITLSNLTGNLELSNVADGAVFHIGQGVGNFYVLAHMHNDNEVVAGNDLSVHLAPNNDFSTLTLLAISVDDLTLVMPPAESATPLGNHVNLSSISHLDSLVVTGEAPGGLLLSYVNADVVDLSGFVGSVGVNAAAVGRVIGSSGADEIYANGTVGSVEAGAGNDILGGRGAVKLLGGAGADRFIFSDHPELQLPIVGDFKKGTDTLDLHPLVTNFSYPNPNVGADFDYGTWYSKKISLASGASFNAYLNAAASKQPSSTHAAITWFQHGGDAYVVVDNSYAQSTFQNGADRHIKLVGVTDLSTLTFDSAQGLLH